VGYIVDALVKMRDQKFTRFEIKAEVVEKHNQRIQKDLKTTVFNAGGCKSYYLDENGRNFAAWPYSLQELRNRLKVWDKNDYTVTTEKSTVN